MEKSAQKTLPLRKIQKLIGKRMMQSKRTKPCFYLEAKADITDLMAMRPKLKKHFGVKITTNVFYIYTLALAVKKFPLTVATLDADNIKIADNINIGFAVNAPQGLVVPVVKNADKKTLPQIAQLEKQLTENARSNKLTLEQIEGETIAMSNLGAYGIDSFLGIVPPPVTAILAIGNVVQKLIPIQGSIKSRKIVSLTIAADSRIITPSYAARFLEYITEQFKNPADLI